MLNSDASFIRPVVDVFGRPLRSLRISVTDRCNLRCHYCMPEDEYVWLHLEEISILAGIFAALGVDKIRLTGGEPLLRHDLSTLIRLLAQKEGIRDLALTTNGVLLRRHAKDLRAAGLQRITVSLDTLRPERFQILTRSAAHSAVLDGIQAAREAGFEKIKINAVILRGFNEDELADLIQFGRQIGGEIRFIEYMDVGGATRWSLERVMTRAEMLEVLERRFGAIRP